MPQTVLVRAAVMAGTGFACLTAAALVAPPASAGEPSLPPGLCSLPQTSAAPLVAVPLTDPFGRKWR